MELPKTQEEWLKLQKENPFWFQDENGVDLISIQQNLLLTPTQRIERMIRCRQVAMEVRRAAAAAGLRSNP